MTRTLPAEELEPTPEDGWVYAKTFEFTERADGRSDGLYGSVEHIEDAFDEAGLEPGDVLQAYVLTHAGEAVAFERNAFKTSHSFSIAEKYRRRLDAEAGDKAHVWIRAPPNPEPRETTLTEATEAAQAAGDGGSSTSIPYPDTEIERPRAIAHATDDIIETVERIEERFDKGVAERAVKIFVVEYLRGEQ